MPRQLHDTGRAARLKRSTCHLQRPWQCCSPAAQMARAAVLTGHDGCTVAVFQTPQITPPRPDCCCSCRAPLAGSSRSTVPPPPAAAAAGRRWPGAAQQPRPWQHQRHQQHRRPPTDSSSSSRACHRGRARACARPAAAGLDGRLEARWRWHRLAYVHPCSTTRIPSCDPPPMMADMI